MKNLSPLLIASIFFLPACGSDAEGSTAEHEGGSTNGVEERQSDLPGAADEDVNSSSPASDVLTASDGGQQSDGLDGPEPRADLSWDVGAAGPFNAGHRTAEWSYESLSTGAQRTIEYHIWYPTEATEGDEVFYAEIFIDEDALGDVPLAPPVSGDTYPLHIHSHGNLGYAGSSPHLMRHFATHGWVVVAPSHKGNTIIDNISPRPNWMYTVRSEDISATLDALSELPTSDPLAGKLDTNAALLSGHSYGAYTTLGLSGASFNPERIAELCPEGDMEACSEAVRTFFASGVRDPRLLAAIPMAPGSYSMYGEGIADVAIPTLHMTGSEDRPEANEDIWAALPAPSYRVHVAGGCHQLFSLGGCELIEDDPGLMIINAYALAFGRSEMLGDTGVQGLMNGSEVIDPSVTFSVK